MRRSGSAVLALGVIAAACVLTGCVKVRTLPMAADDAPDGVDEASPVMVYAAENPFQIEGVYSTVRLPADAQTVGHLVVSRSLAGWAARADDDHIIEVTKKRARQLGGDAIVVLRWSTTDVRHENIAALPVPLPGPDESKPSDAERLMALGMTAAANPAIAIPAFASGVLTYAIFKDVEPVWLFGRPPVSMTARVVRTGSAPDGLGLEIEPGQSRADVVEHVHEVDVAVVR